MKSTQDQIKELKGFNVKNVEAPSGYVYFPNVVNKEAVLEILKTAKEELDELIKTLAELKFSKEQKKEYFTQMDGINYGEIVGRIQGLEEAIKVLGFKEEK